MSAPGPLLTVAAIVAVAFACVIVAILPLVTMAAGQAHIRDYVVKPDHCVALMDRPTRMARYEQKAQAREEKNDKEAPAAALCVRVIVGDSDRHEGRVVFATSSSVVLYDPRTGDVRRVPLSDGVMEVVPDLPSSP